VDDNNISLVPSDKAKKNRNSKASKKPKKNQPLKFTEAKNTNKILNTSEKVKQNRNSKPSK